MLTTETWAKLVGVSVEPNLPPIQDYSKRCARTAHQIAVRALILQSVVAVAQKVDPEPIVEWYHDQQIWDSISPEEKALLLNPAQTQERLNKFIWHMEAQWTLLWVVGKVESLGLPTRGCDTRRLCFEILPQLGTSIASFVASAELRPPGVLLAEDLRTYNLWCYALGARRKKEQLPDDLNWSVLYERRYALEWLDGNQDWDAVTCDA